MPIGVGNKTECIENLDILTPNRLIMGRNNDRSSTAPLVLERDLKHAVETNAKIFSIWFKSWLVSYVPTFMERPRWFDNDSDICSGDVVLFLKSEQEFDRQYQYGIVKSVLGGGGGGVTGVYILS